MSNELSILGFGQCGSRIAVEISASFNPAEIFSGLPGFSIKLLFERFGNKPTKTAGQHPAFYIADLNSSNDVYVHYAKAQAICKVLDVTDKQLSNKDIMDRVNRGTHGVMLEQEDFMLIDDVRKQQAALRMVRALYFAVRNEPLLKVGGAGGLQYLSEVIADQDENLLQSIDKREGGALIGIFSLGGGTGSGSLYSVLSNYKRRIPRYTVGVGILPYPYNRDQFSNAGRYLTKFLGSDISDRFNTLFLFSNDVARTVLVGGTLTGSDDPLKIINSYVSSFIHDFSLINDSRTETLFGKLFDPMDGKRYLSGLSTIGYASDRHSSDSRFSARELFANAISPMSYQGGRICGVAVKVVREPSAQDDIRTLIHQVVGPTEFNINLSREAGETLRRKTPFYRTIKSVHVFYFICNRDFLAEAYTFQDDILQSLRSISGDNVSVDVNCYLTPGSASGQRDNSVLVLLGGAFSFEVYESVVAYVGNAFVKATDQREFRDAFNKVLVGTRDVRVSEVHDEGVDEEVNKVLRRVTFREAELIDEAEDVEIYSHPAFRDVVGGKQLENILIRPDAVKKTLVTIASQFMLGASKVEVETDPFS